MCSHTHTYLHMSQLLPVIMDDSEQLCINLSVLSLLKGVIKLGIQLINPIVGGGIQ